MPREPTSRLGSIGLTLIGLAIVCLPLLGTSEASSPSDPILARWRGGQLTESEFRRAFDPDGEILAEGGRLLQESVCKVSFWEIYTELASATGLAKDPGVVHEIQQVERDLLAAEYLKAHTTEVVGSISSQDLLSHYEALKAEEFTGSPRANVAILFVRCHDNKGQACLETIEAYERRLENGEDLSELAKEERPSSGEANGEFENVALTKLSTELRAAIEATPSGSLSPRVSTSAGHFRLRVDRKVDGRIRPFEEARSRVKKLLEQERTEAWQQREVERWRKKLDAPSNATTEEIFAAAARREGLDKDPVVVERIHKRSRWRLADEAFLHDTQHLPTDGELQETLDSSPHLIQRYRLYDVRLLVLPFADDRWETVGKANSLRDTLQASSDVRLGFEEVANDRSDLHRLSLAGQSEVDLRRHSESLRKAVVDLPVGGWAGPFLFEDENSPALDGLAFVLVEARRVPQATEIRRELLEHRRNQVGVSIESFQELVGRHWDFELLVP